MIAIAILDLVIDLARVVGSDGVACWLIQVV